MPIDQSRPNHLIWDSLGNPYTCTENHNHPHDADMRFPDGLTDEQIALALEDEEFAKAIALIPRWKRVVFWPVAFARTAAHFAARGLRAVPWWPVIQVAAMLAFLVVGMLTALRSPGTAIAVAAVLATTHLLFFPRRQTVHHAPTVLHLDVEIPREPAPADPPGPTPVGNDLAARIAKRSADRARNVKGGTPE